VSLYGWQVQFVSFALSSDSRNITRWYRALSLSLSLSRLAGNSLASWTAYKSGAVSASSVHLSFEFRGSTLPTWSFGSGENYSNLVKSIPITSYSVQFRFPVQL